MVSRYEKFGKALELIEMSKKVAITSHVRPDGDALGSVRALSLALESMEKEAKPFFLSDIPKWYEFLFDKKPSVLGKDFQIEDLQEGKNGWEGVDLFVVVDTNSFVQLPGLEEYLKTRKIPVVVFDHHITNDGLGDAQALDPSAAAAGEVIFDFIAYAGVKITKKMAESLFVAISADTGWFRFGNRNGDVYRRAASLIDFGIDPAKIYQRLYQNFELPKIKLAARAIDNMEMALDGRVCIQVVTQDDFRKTGAGRRDTEGLIEEGQKLGSVRAAVTFIEQPDGGYKCSFRSKGEINVRKIAQKYGGGGHDFAAGAVFNCSLDEAKKIVVEEMNRQFLEMGQ